MSAAADRNLLFGILALQMDFITRDALVAAMNGWILAKHRPLGEVLMEQGALSLAHRELLEALVAEHVRQHGDDARQSLAALSSVDHAAETLPEIADAEVRASLHPAPGTLRADNDEHPTMPPPHAPPGRYTTLRPHARGGLGEVFVAHDAELNREVALKELQARHAGNPDNRGRFLWEAEVTGRLEHPGIVPVYGLGAYADGRPYYAMRLIEGEDLRQAIHRFHDADHSGRDAGARRLAFRDLLARFVAVCNAVAYAHSRGVLHRDLKPANIMLGKYGETLVVDWGLAKSAGRQDGITPADATVIQPRAGEAAPPTQHGAALGTPAYMSPEQAAGQLDKVGPATDVYGLGATLFTLLTGATPVEGSDLGEVLRKVKAGETTAPRQVAPATPRALDAVCRKAMARRPEDRYTSALDLAADIEHWLADEPVLAYREPLAARAGRWVRRHRSTVAAGAAAAVVALLLGGGVLEWQQRERARRRAETEAALQRVDELQSRARWTEARAVLEQAHDHLGDSGPADLRQRLEAARRYLELVARLDDLRMIRAAVPQGGYTDRQITDQDFQAAFAEAGIGGPDEDPSEVGARVAISPVREVLVAALDDWAASASDEMRPWVLAVARRADPDPWRDQLRDPAVWSNTVALVKLAREAPTTAATPGLAGAVGARLRKVGEGESLLRAAQSHHPEDFWLNFILGAVLRAKGQWKEAEGFDRAALALRPDSASAHNNLGLSLYHQDKLTDAADHYRRAMQLSPEYGMAPFNLTRVLLALGQYPEAGAAARSAIALLPAAHPLRPQAEGLLQQSQLGERLAAAIRGDDQAASAAEGVAFGELCFARRRYADAVPFFAKAFAADPNLAADLRTKHRYNAACYAASAGCGQGEGAPPSAGEERPRLRAQALAWLRADLTLRARQLAGSPKEKAEAMSKLRLWLRDDDLTGVRDAAGLAQLPEAERQTWEAFWVEVRNLLAPQPNRGTTPPTK